MNGGYYKTGHNNAISTQGSREMALHYCVRILGKGEAQPSLLEKAVHQFGN